MSNHTPSQQKRFDDIYELYHFNPFHDRMGRFASSSGGARSFVSPSGVPTDKARRRLKFANYEDYANLDSGGGGKKNKRKKNKSKGSESEQGNKDEQNKSKGSESEQKESKKDKKKSTDAETERINKAVREALAEYGIDPDDDSGGNNKGDNGGGGKKKDKGIRLDPLGRIVKEDENRAIHEMEQEISKDWSNKSKVMNDSSRLVNDLVRFRDRNRDRSAKAKAASEDLSGMSNDELSAYINERRMRANLERQYREIKEADYNRGRAKLDDILETTGTVLALGATAATIAATIHTLKS
jgi:hypothetical protein